MSTGSVTDNHYELLWYRGVCVYLQMYYIKSYIGWRFAAFISLELIVYSIRYNGQVRIYIKTV